MLKFKSFYTSFVNAVSTIRLNLKKNICHGKFIMHNKFEIAPKYDKNCTEAKFTTIDTATIEIWDSL